MFVGLCLMDAYRQRVARKALRLYEPQRIYSPRLIDGDSYRGRENPAPYYTQCPCYLTGFSARC